MSSEVGAYPRVGADFGGYRIERLLGRGGMGVVYLAHDLRLDRPVALKLLSPSLAEDAEFRARFLRESKLAASLDHQNVVPVFEAGEVDGTLFIAMRYVEGTDLRELLRTEAPLAAERTVALLSQVAAALDAAHEHGLIHRDVKPGNILLAADDHVYLADFGLTRRAEDPDAGPAAGNSLGTVDYVAPEQIQGDPVDGRADVYSLGCVLYECLTGTPPFSSSSPMGVLWEHVQADPPSLRESEAELPDAIDPVIERALAKEPSDRYPSGHELMEDTREALGVATRPAHARFRRRTVALLLGLALALVGVATAAIVLAQGDAPAASPPAVSVEPTLAPEVDSVQRIDPATNTLVATIGAGEDPGSVATGEGAVWVTSNLANTVTRIGVTADDMTTSRIPSKGPRDVVVADGLVWVLETSTAIDRLNPDTGTHVDTLPPNVSGSPNLLAVGEDAVWGTALCRCGDPNAPLSAHGVVRLSFGGLYVSSAFRIEVPRAAPTGIAVGEGAVWVANDYNALANLARFDPDAEVLAATIPLRDGAAGVAVGAGAVWVANPVGDTVSRVDPATNEVTRRIAVGDDPIAVAYGDGSVWVTNYNDGTVSRIDPATNTVEATIDVGPRPDHVAVGEGGVWVTVQAG